MLEVTKGQTMMQHRFSARLLSFFLTDYSKCIALLDQLYFIQRESRESHADPILIFRYSFNVVGRPIRPSSTLQHVKEPVKADRRAKQGRKIVSPHDHILPEQHGNETVDCRAVWPRRPTRYFGGNLASRGEQQKNFAG